MMSGDVPSILKQGVYDRDLPPTSAHNIEAARRFGLRYDSKKKAFVDAEGSLVRDRFFQPF